MSNFSMKMATSVAIIGGIVAGAVSAQAALNLPTQSCAYVFNTNMKLGSRGADVMNLQKVLNMFPQTQVSASGAGSPGMETSTFGPATRAAANKFQALHLAELGITAPTGNVFAGTRALLNQVCNGTVSTNPGTTPGTTVSGPVSAMLAGSQPTGMVINNQSGARLADITFTGNGSVTAVELQRIGVSTDSVVNNVYLYDGNVRITDAASVSTGGYVRFTNSNGLFTVNGSRTITVRADLATVASQSVGVKLNSITSGGSVSTFTNVIGNTLSGANVTPAGVAITVTASPLTPDAGVMGYNVWSSSASVSTRAVNLRAATFKFVGSAPTDAMQNINLFVDGVKVAGPVAVNAANNNKISFDLGNSPVNLTVGSHTIDLRADLVKGSNRTITISVENVADLMLEDTGLSGVNISSTVNGSAFTQSAATFGTITLNKGSVTVNTDATFTASQVTGGATNVPVGQFTMKAYGEDVKVNTLQVTFSTTTNSTFNNVSLYANGGQVGNSQNFSGTALSYSLGSSLIIPAGQTVTITVKADMVNTSGTAYTAGTIATVLGGVSSNAQGQNSYELVSAAGTAITGNTLTITSGAGTFTKTAGFVAQTVSPNTSAVKIGSFSLQAGSAESVRVTSIGVNPVVGGSGLSAANTISNYSNLTLKSGSTVLGTPVGNPSSGTSTFSVDLTIPMNGSQTFDVYADIGANASTTATPTVTTAMSATYRGTVSNTTVTSSAAGIAISSTAATLSAATLVSTSPVAQFVVGGQTMGIATFKLKTAAAGTSATVNKLAFVTTGSNAIESITVAGVTKGSTGDGAGATTTFTGLNIYVPYTGVDVPVTVKFAQFQGAGNPAAMSGLTAGVASASITLGHVEGTSGSGAIITTTTPVNSNAMKLYASKPTVTGPTITAGSLTSGTIKIGEFTIKADANGKIAVATTSIVISTSTSGTLNVTNVKLSDDGGATAIANSNTVAAPLSGTPFAIGFTTPYEISANESKTFSVYGTVAGGFGASGASSMSTQLNPTSSAFLWNDVVSGSNGLTGDGIQNFGVSSYVLKN